MNWIQNALDSLLGLQVEPRDLTLLQLSLRALVVFIASLLMLRLAHKRFFAGKNAIDVLLTFILASTLSRAINGSASFFGTIAVGFILVLLHNFLTWAACRFHPFGKWLKGHSQVVIADGQIDDHTLQKHHVSRNDLEEDLRLNGSLIRPEEVQLAMLERNGEISVVPKSNNAFSEIDRSASTLRAPVERSI